MLKSISLKNFRSHKDTVLEFCSGINILTGPNDSGKTNILRALNWIINNRPMGDDVRSDWGGDTEVHLDIGKKLVGRIKTNSKNLYTLTHASGDEDEFKSFNKGVPEIINKHLNISPINIAFQLDGPFLLSKSASDVAKFYNEIVNLDIIDRSISNIASTLRKERTALKAETEREAELTEKLKEYDWLPGAEAELARLEKSQRAISGLKADWTELHGLAREYERLTEASTKLDEIVKHGKAVEDLLRQDREIERAETDYVVLEDLIGSLERLTKTNRELDRIIKHKGLVADLLRQQEAIDSLKADTKALAAMIAEIERLKAEEGRCLAIVGYAEEAERLIGLDAQIAKDTDEYNALFDLVEKWGKLNRELSEADSRLIALEAEWWEGMPEACPIFSVKCGHITEARK